MRKLACSLINSCFTDGKDGDSTGSGAEDIDLGPTKKELRQKKKADKKKNKNKSKKQKKKDDGVIEF